MPKRKCPGCNETLPSPNHHHSRQYCEDKNYNVLLQVARAVIEHRRVHKIDENYTTVGSIWEMQATEGELEEALKEVEHLL